MKRSRFIVRRFIVPLLILLTAGILTACVFTACAGGSVETAGSQEKTVTPQEDADGSINVAGLQETTVPPQEGEGGRETVSVAEPVETSIPVSSSKKPTVKEAVATATTAKTSVTDESHLKTTATVSPSGETTPTGTPSLSPVPPKDFLVAIDPGHQGKGNSEREPIGPGASETKAKVSSGTSGRTTGVPEYQLTLDVSLKLRDELTARGYQVLMIRETHDVDISNKERAEMAAEADADILVRIHADGSANTEVNGISTLCPTAGNPYVSHLYEQSRKLSDLILAAAADATGANRRNVMEVDNMSGINWSTVPVTIVEMGFMTNQREDELMQTEDYQWKLAQGIADGIEAFNDLQY